MSNAKSNLETLESRIGLMAALAKIIDIDRGCAANEGESPNLNDFHYGALVEAIEIVAQSCYGELGQLDDAFKKEAVK
ncbi:hypothetical protein [Vreelandella neptunia]|uniref:Phage protein n=1 Tax=Vreelandella neptunia TaxID=115551 RepID=A0ABZ0YK40_9GAMM|nr:hypothetical protein [Halomonas neptunia]MDN3561242.1 hypothetical protein [Halomonas neptunia]WQH12477.1 hypothetical protein SR894_20400 [Halomonas neptunia]